jgi:HK97 family phage prohead protease
MSRLSDAIVIDSDSVFEALEGESREAVFEYRFNLPFTVDKAATESLTTKEGGDTVVYGPVYVGDDGMLDRHRELVDAKAIMDSWESYSKNPVILYNHRKDYGVIGLMESVEMGVFEADDGTKMEAVFGRAIIDSGEIDITRKINKGMLRAFSIGFMAKAAVKEGKGDDAYIRFTNIEWIETSVVDIPASPNALFNVSKSLISYGDEVVKRDSESHLLSELSEKMDSILTHLTQPIGNNTLKDHVPDPIDMTDVEELTEELTEAVVDDSIVELSAPAEMITLKTEELVEEEALEEPLEEAVVEEALEESPLEEVIEEALEEELVTEMAEATEEESIVEEVIEMSAEEDPSMAILTEVVKALSEVENGLNNLVARLDETESLKSALAEKDVLIATLTEQKAVADAEATIEAEVSKRLAEAMAKANLSPTTAVPKSLSANTKTVILKTSVTDSPELSNGMAHLGAWLENRIGA